MAYDIRSITQVGTSEPFELQVARGQIPGHSVVHKFGANFDIDNNSEPETVWTAGGLYPWSALSMTNYFGYSLTRYRRRGCSRNSRFGRRL